MSVSKNVSRLSIFPFHRNAKRTTLLHTTSRSYILWTLGRGGWTGRCRSPAAAAAAAASATRRCAALPPAAAARQRLVHGQRVHGYAPTRRSHMSFIVEAQTTRIPIASRMHWHAEDVHDQAEAALEIVHMPGEPDYPVTAWTWIAAVAAGAARDQRQTCCAWTFKNAQRQRTAAMAQYMLLRFRLELEHDMARFLGRTGRSTCGRFWP